MSNGPNLETVLRRAAFHVGRILGKTPAGDLPIEQPTKLAILVNLPSAKAMDLKLGSALLGTADEVIE